MKMIDLHCHILPGVDDGSPDIETSLKLAEVAVEQGITHMLLTPHHMDGDYLNHKADVIEKTTAFQEALDRNQIRLTVFPGQEVHITGELIQATDRDDILFADESNRYLILELPHNEVPEYTEKMLFALQTRGITPILVHPERNQGFMQDPDKLYEFVSQGCLTQLTASSYVGVFGEHVQKFTEQIVDAGLGFVFASDAHNLKGRNFKMAQAFEKLEKNKGKRFAEIYRENAKSIINGDDVILGEIHHVHEKKRKKFWRFF
ncbi:tyrosine-protein phosphatase [Pediococcus ethanolidurans]|uniref:tyrosine-protein phosphatase n=1 Tax=Pediococcus ethanolidurans TaxID=319653 RepID=UPI0021E8E8DE|nr:CpsB/CapC family capsule biosynthesis tyrosine phosphatase [Pediococcus ethanolidurans]MCV3554527.1 tyrosine protein phosphatase [Pediococcus ethanolidurans]